ncbi:uncharacterized protein B0I36DRAFT_254052 [Microdochium trichocladiopsis]|uniref:PD-(D/E)XK nuclease-like domain-containing protein n=1 Tax=Microdochium trichocladiopsis TaxID=1682393 RepID=A0A9P8XUZ7_9PEZI|nr:uncharacterized protein B0I36DRAFT_254052 [Microdochium trichocladiopsis]KAH7016137.1 hypothetical protein B0I36DRAFT_254052 [Microdochium trichocladiopsis]
MSPGSDRTNTRQRQRRRSREDENDLEDYPASGDSIQHNTPRAARVAHPRLDRTPTASSSASRSDWSGQSRSSRSPTKRIRRLEVARNKSLVLQIDRADLRMPAALKNELAQLRQCSRGDKVIPPYLQDELTSQRGSDETLYDITDAAFATKEDELTMATAGFPLLSMQAVRDISLEAKECYNHGHAEASWNMLVHWPLLALALGRNEQQPQDPTQPRVHAMPCTMARLSGDARGTKMIDFCLYIDPADGCDKDRIDELRAQRPSENINHTDYTPLRARPIVLSAESKKPGEQLAEAHLQLAVWQDRQLRLLESDIAPERRKDTMIAFLPSLVIQGHEWWFTAATRHEGATILWTQQHIGSTSTPLGIFQILHGLRHIACWASKIYWPWFCKHILRTSMASTMMIESKA